MSLNLFSGSGEDGDIWDDTELVQHFEAALEMGRKTRGKDEILEAEIPGPWRPVPEGEGELENGLSDIPPPLVLNSENSKQAIKIEPNESIVTRNGGEGQHVWQEGSYCRTVFAADGLEYEARVTEILDDTTCVVRFVGYGNEEEVELSNLAVSLGKGVREFQRVQAQQVAAAELNLSEGPGEEEDESPGAVSFPSAPQSSANTSATATANGTRRQPIDLDDLQERVRKVILSRNKTEPQPEDEYEEELEEEESPRYRPVIKARRGPKKNNRGQGQGQSTHEYSPCVSFASTLLGGMSPRAQVVQPIQQQQQQQRPPAPGNGGPDWAAAFPNLYMPPMPTTLGGQSGNFNYGRGDMTSLLMSWYMAGYHSGAFDARQEMRKKTTTGGLNAAEARSGGDGMATARK